MATSAGATFLIRSCFRVRSPDHQERCSTWAAAKADFAACVSSTGIDPTPALIAAARTRDPGGVYFEAEAEHLPFADESFDLVVSYLSLIDISDVRPAIHEMARVLQSGASMLIASLNSFNSACCDTGWVKDSTGQRLFYPIDHYLRERAMWIEYRGTAL